MTKAYGRLALEGLTLAAALLFVFLVTFLPHARTAQTPFPEEGPALVRLADSTGDLLTGEREGYPYPIHVDEHLHWVWMSSIQRQDRVMIDYPYTGTPASRDALLTMRGAVHERGFQLSLAMVQEITGVPFVTIFHFLPAAWLTFTAFAVYAALRPSSAAIPAAFFVGLVPTTLRFMGPAFLVPIGFSLAWIPVTLILLEGAWRRIAGAFLLLAVIAWAFFIHLIGGFAAVGILGLGLIAQAGRDWKKATALILLALAPVAWLARTFSSDVQGELEREESLPIDFTIFDGFGVWALFGWVAGVSMMALYARPGRRPQLYAFAAFSVVALFLILGTVAFEWGKYATYARWHPPFFLTAAVPLGYLVGIVFEGLQETVRVLVRNPRIHRPTGRAIGAVAAVCLAAVLVSPGVHGHMREPYYYVLSDGDWTAINHAQSAGPAYEVFLTHPWKAPFLTAVSGKYPHTVLLPGTPPAKGEDYTNYLRTGGTLEFFILNDVTLVLTTGKPPHAEFVSLGPGVWGLRPDIAQEIARIRADERAASG